MHYDLYKIKSIEKAINMLKLFNSKSPELTLNELGKALNIHKSSAHRIAVTLANGGLLKWDPYKGTYSLGLMLLELSGVLSNNLEIRSQARPNLEKLHQDTGELVHLVVLDDGEIVYIDKVESKKGIRLYSEIGKRALCHCTALGKAILSGLPNESVRAILKEKGMKRFTQNTIVEIPELIKQLEEVRKNGYALDMEEHEPMIYCLAVPIKDYSGKCIAAVSITCIARNSAEVNLVDNYKDIMLKTGKQISCELGYIEDRSQVDGNQN